jgi:hypothetical protein
MTYGNAAIDRPPPIPAVQGSIRSMAGIEFEQLASVAAQEQQVGPSGLSEHS